jgi:hypothetical protein
VLVGLNAHQRNDPATLRQLKTRGIAPVTAAQATELAKRAKAIKYLEFQQQQPTEAVGASAQALFEEVVRAVVFPTTRHQKELAKRERMLEKVRTEVAAAMAAEENRGGGSGGELSFKKKGWDSTHIPKSFGKDMRDIRKLVRSPLPPHDTHDTHDTHTYCRVLTILLLSYVICRWRVSCLRVSGAERQQAVLLPAGAARAHQAADPRTPQQRTHLPPRRAPSVCPPQSPRRPPPTHLTPCVSCVRVSLWCVCVFRMSSLKKLDVENNQLSALPGEMGAMTHLEELKLRGNLLDQFLPPEAQANGTRGILAYLRDLHKGAERCYRMKIMFVGKEAAGKTSVRSPPPCVCRVSWYASCRVSCADRVCVCVCAVQLSYFLLNNKKMERAPLSTDGIDINSWEIPFSDVEPELGEKYMRDNWSNKPISFSVWDFAGQEVYYSTHQFYLSRRSMYLVAFNLMDDDILKGTLPPPGLLCNELNFVFTMQYVDIYTYFYISLN